MPNWCNNNIVVDGNAQQVKELNRVMEELENLPEPRVKNDFGNTWLGCLVDAVGKDWNDVDCRGEWFERSYDEEKNIIRFDCSTAWSPWHVVDTMEAIKEKYPDINYYYIAEEPGCEVFVNNDVEGKYFPWRYHLDVYDGKTGGCMEVYTTIEEVYKDVGEWAGREITSQQELDDAIESLNKEWGENDGFIYLHTYVYE